MECEAPVNVRCGERVSLGCVWVNCPIPRLSLEFRLLLLLNLVLKSVSKHVCVNVQHFANIDNIAAAAEVGDRLATIGIGRKV